jgi:hypothetical protein
MLHGEVVVVQDQEVVVH